MKWVLTLIFAGLWFLGVSQPVVKLGVKVQYQGELLVLNERYYTIDSTQWVSFSKVQFYWKPTGDAYNYHLVDWSDPASLHYELPATQPPTRLDCIFGVDSLTNSQGVKGGDLDPIHGMYWTWNSGYIHVKIEGEASWSEARKQRFIYHLGGYQGKYPAIAYQTFNWPKNSDSAQLNVPLDHVVGFSKPTYGETIMSPSEKVVTVLQALVKGMELE